MSSSGASVHQPYSPTDTHTPTCVSACMYERMNERSGESRLKHMTGGYAPLRDPESEASQPIIDPHRPGVREGGRRLTRISIGAQTWAYVERCTHACMHACMHVCAFTCVEREIGRERGAAHRRRERKAAECLRQPASHLAFIRVMTGGLDSSGWDGGWEGGREACR
eukprot:GHVU01089472.1.p1 GENE.GHVU01089472.1~~GHVU01089472.1.p1  ORF type:complete len:167 (-),score=5.99 GHVU01089472.1:252-752(-)